MSMLLHLREYQRLNVTDSRKRLYCPSFDRFIDHGIPHILKKPDGFVMECAVEKLENKFDLKLKITKLRFDNYELKKKKCQYRRGEQTLKSAQENFQTYGLDIYVDMSIREYIFQASGKSLEMSKRCLEEHKDVKIGTIPIMSGSKYCTTSLKERCGDYTIKGRTKHIVMHHTSIENQILLVNNAKGGHAVVHSRSISDPLLSNPTYVNEEKGQLIIRSKIFKGITKNKERGLHPQLPLFLLLRGFGLKTDKDIFDAIVGPHKNNPEFCRIIQSYMTKYIHDSLLMEETKMSNSSNTWAKDELDMVIIYMKRGRMFNKTNKNLQNSNHSKKVNRHTGSKVNILTPSEIYIRAAIITGTKKDVMERILKAYPNYHDMNRIRSHDRIRRKFLPHLNSDVSSFKACLLKRALYLCKMTRMLIEVKMGMRKWTDRDSFKNKRFVMPYEIFMGTFSQGFKKMYQILKKSYKKDMARRRKRLNPDNCSNTPLKTFVDSEKISQTIKTAFDSGDFYISNDRCLKGMTGELTNISLIDKISTQTRIKPAVYEICNRMPANQRLMHTSAYGYICPVETPEGHTTGKNNNISLTTEFSISSNESKTKLVSLVAKYELSDKSPISVMINGNFYGRVRRYHEFHRNVVKMKRLGQVSRHTSIVLDIIDKTLSISTEAGRMVRPLLVVDRNHLFVHPTRLYKIMRQSKTWEEFLEIMGEGIEYLDVRESLNSMIASNIEQLREARENADKNIRFKNFTHMEVHPSLFLGRSASQLPFPNHNPAARNSFQSSQIKSAIGIPSKTCFRDMISKKMYVMHSPHKPLLRPNVTRHIGTEVLPNGQNITIAIMSYTGFNQEDAVIMNQDAVDVGLFHVSSFQVNSVVAQHIIGKTKEEFCNPLNSHLKERQDEKFYTKLDEHGIVKEGTYIKEGDALIGKITPILVDGKVPDDGKMEFNDSSVKASRGVKGVVDRVKMINSTYSNNRCTVRIRSKRIPIVGDKFSSRQGQKGVIGILLPARDMPRTPNGIIPDLIINPHAMPSRMTVPYLMEQLMGIVAIENGQSSDATAFEDPNILGVQEDLRRYGYDEWGLYPMMNGMTGEMLHARICVGPVYYQRLKHMAKDKIFSAAFKINRDHKTRQPADGRSRNGGLRFGEMERDAVIAHGTTELMYERLHTVSDKTTRHVCKHSGEVASFLNEYKRYQCPTCANKVVKCIETGLKATLSFDENNIPKNYRCVGGCSKGCKKVRKLGFCQAVSEVNAPYPFWLMLQNMQTCNIKSKVRTSSKLLSA